MNEDNRTIQINKKISRKGKVHSESNNYETIANEANSRINDEFYHNERKTEGISPALLLNNVPLVETERK